MRASATHVRPPVPGDKPIAPQRQHLIRANVTGIGLELTSWQDGGCAISYFTVEFRRAAGTSGNSGSINSRQSHGHQHQHQSTGGGGGLSPLDWIVVSSNVPPHSRFGIPDLEPATGYQLRVTAHNNAGATIAEYYFETLPVGGVVGAGLMGGGGGLSGVMGMNGGGMGGMNDGRGDGGYDGDEADPDADHVWGETYLVGVSFLALVSVGTTLSGISFCFYSRECTLAKTSITIKTLAFSSNCNSIHSRGKPR